MKATEQIRAARALLADFENQCLRSADGWPKAPKERDFLTLQEIHRLLQSAEKEASARTT